MSRKKVEDEGKVVINKEFLIRMTAKKLNASIVSVKEVYNVIEESLLDEFRKAHLRQEKTLVKMFEGISFECSQVASRQILNNFTGVMVETEPFTRIKPNVTRNLRNKINALEEPGELEDLEAIERLTY